MREIKFRVWDTWEKIMLYGINVLGTDYSRYMQYTGLKDSKGNEIYEGDIYSYPVEFYYDNQLIKKNTKVIVRYEDGAFLVGYKLLGDALRVDVEGEIIGNFFENPELLGVEKD